MSLNLEIDKAYVQRRLEIDGYDVHMTAFSPFSGGPCHVITDMTATISCDPPGVASVMYPAPLQLGQKSAQILFQAMWDAGLRPADGSSGSAHVEAIQRHLEDMRNIAMHYAIPREEQMIADRPRNHVGGDF